LLKRFLFLSPHLDDAVLCSGAYICELVQNLNRVLIVTVFSGSEDSQYLSPLAKRFHDACGLGDNAVFARKAEDDAAAKFLKAETIRLDLLECLYRRDENGLFRCKDPGDIFSGDVDREKDTINEIISALSERLSFDDFEEIYIPLGIGRHIDHLISRKAAEALCAGNEARRRKLRYYEDIPYVCHHRDTSWEVQLTERLESYPYVIGETQFDQYLQAIELYKSQMSVLWDNSRQMKTQLKKHYMCAGGRTFTGRLWRIKEPTE